MRRSLLALALLLALSPTISQGQERQCRISAAGRTVQVQEGSSELILLHDPFTVLCDDGAELRANSGRLDRTLHELHLVGDVFFQDSLQTLTSNEATYNSETARLWARGNVFYVDRQDGSTLSGPELEYLRQTEDRPIAEMTAVQRPTLTMAPEEGSTTQEPLQLVADRVFLRGEDEMSAFGSVLITRSDLDASSGEAYYNSASEQLDLLQNAVIRNEDFTLRGDSVRARLADGALSHVRARIDAYLEGEDLRVTGDELQMFFENDLLQRAVAWVPRDQDEVRARAVSATFQMEADSLDALFTDQRIEELHAIGRARGETIDTTAVALEPAEADTVTDGAPGPSPELLASDWIRGDTIIGTFAAVERPQESEADSEPDAPNQVSPPGADGTDEPSLAPAADVPETPSADSPDAVSVPDPALAADESDTEEQPEVELRRLVARGSAQSLYRMKPEDASEDDHSRNVNFLVGQQITLELVDGELDVADVQGLQYGVYLEAQPTTPAEPAGADTPDEPEIAPTTVEGA